MISCGRPLASSNELRRPRLGAPHPHPNLELPLEGLCAQTLRDRDRARFLAGLTRRLPGLARDLVTLGWGVELSHSP